MDTEYSDDTLDEIISQVKQWNAAFADSEYYERLTHDQQQESEFIVTSFAELLYKYELLEPTDWNESAVRHCVLELYPENVTASQDHFRAIAPILEAFLSFLGETGHLDNGTTLAMVISERETDIAERAADPDNWGMAKSMLMDAAEQAGADVDAIESLEDAEALLQEAGIKPVTYPDEDEPRMLSVESEQRFLELFGHLLVYVNDRCEVLDGVDTYADIEQRDTKQLAPLRNALYENDTVDIIETFVTENPAELDDTDLQQVDQWTEYVFGEFMVMRHLDDAAVFVDWEEPPQAYRVKTVRLPFSDIWHENDLPIMGADVALLPFEGQIVWDGWLFTDPISSMAVEMTLEYDLDDRYEEAKHRFGLIDSLPAPDEEETSDAEQLRFYLKNKRNRERFADDIAELRDTSLELERIYHQEMGKARARSLGRTLRDLDLNEAYVAIYDDQVVTTGRTEQEVRDILGDIMPDGKENHPYIYYYDP